MSPPLTTVARARLLLSIAEDIGQLEPGALCRDDRWPDAQRLRAAVLIVARAAGLEIPVAELIGINPSYARLLTIRALGRYRIDPDFRELADDLGAAWRADFDREVIP